MPRSIRSSTIAVALAALIGATSFGSSASACSLVRFRDNGRYVGGDLTAQIAAKADTIQIVTVSARHLVRRTYTEGQWYLQFGDTEFPKDRPEFVDEFVFALEPTESLKVTRDEAFPIYEDHLRVGGYDPGVFGDAVARVREDTGPFNRLPAWLHDRPGDGGYAFMGASPDGGFGGQCNAPYVLEVGQKLIALRDSIGRLYPASGAFPLEIDVEFSTEQGQADVWGMRMQSLIPIDGPNDPFLLRLREALANKPN